MKLKKKKKAGEKLLSRASKQDIIELTFDFIKASGPSSCVVTFLLKNASPVFKSSNLNQIYKAIINKSFYFLIMRDISC